MVKLQDWRMSWLVMYLAKRRQQKWLTCKSLYAHLLNSSSLITAMQLFVKNTCTITIAGTSLFRSSGFFVMVIELSCRAQFSWCADSIFQLFQF